MHKGKSMNKVNELYLENPINMGEGSGVNGSQWARASKLISNLSSGAPDPHISLSRNGDFIFHWNMGGEESFSILVGEPLVYSGMLAGQEIRGNSYFNEDLPEKIRYYFREFVER